MFWNMMILYKFFFLISTIYLCLMFLITRDILERVLAEHIYLTENHNVKQINVIFLIYIIQITT